MTNFPVGIQNQPMVDSFEKEKTVISLIDSTTGYVTIDTYGYGLINFSIANNLSSVKVAVQSSNDNNTWKDLQPVSLASMPSNLSAASGNAFINQPGNNTYQLPKSGRFIRFIQTSVSDNYTTLSVHLSNGQLNSNTKQLDIPNYEAWSFVSPISGITNATLNVLTPSSNPATNQCLMSLDLYNAGSVDLVITISSNTTTNTDKVPLWRTKLKIGDRITQNFKPAISTKNGSRILEITSDVAGIYFVNAQGWSTNAY